MRWFSRVSSASVTSPSDTRFSAALIASLTVTSGRVPRWTADSDSARLLVISPSESMRSSRPPSPTRTIASHADPLSSSLDSTTTVLSATPVSAAFTAPSASSPALADGRFDAAAAARRLRRSPGRPELGAAEVGGAMEMSVGGGCARLPQRLPQAASGTTKTARPTARPPHAGPVEVHD